MSKNRKSKYVIDDVQKKLAGVSSVANDLFGIIVNEKRPLPDVLVIRESGINRNRYYILKDPKQRKEKPMTLIEMHKLLKAIKVLLELDTSNTQLNLEL